MSEIAPSDVENFINERWASLDCPRCGRVAWRIGSADKFKGILALGDDGMSSVLSKIGLPMYWVLCGYCGHIEFLATKVVRQWKAGGADNGD